jgi:hypothetical protein
MGVKGAIGILIAIAVSSCGETEEDKKQAEMQYHRCVNAGVAYFKEIGSYPILKSKEYKGKHALTEAKERCSRAPNTAF